MSSGRWLIASACAGALTFAAPRASAQAQDAAAAESLFKDGKRLMSLGKFSQACPKFAESQRLDPGIGTLLWLGECYGRNGQYASAWATFHEADALATKNRDPRASVAREEAKKVEPRVSKLVIDVTSTGVGDTPGLVIKRDGVVLGRPLWGTPIPTDAGVHKIVVSAPEKFDWQTEIDVPTGARTATVKIAALQNAPPPPKEEPVANGPAAGEGPRPDPNTGSTQRLIGYSALALGGISVIIGGYFGLKTKSQNDQSVELGCHGNTCTTKEGLDARNAALASADASNIFFGVGAVLGVGGAILVLTAPKPDAPITVGGSATANGFSARLSGRF